MGIGAVGERRGRFRGGGIVRVGIVRRFIPRLSVSHEQQTLLAFWGSLRIGAFFGMNYTYIALNLFGEKVM
jgi:hypothetical protein